MIDLLTQLLKVLSLYRAPVSLFEPENFKGKGLIFVTKLLYVKLN